MKQPQQETCGRCLGCASRDAEIELLQAALTIAEHRNKTLLSKLEEQHGQQKPMYSR